MDVIERVQNEIGPFVQEGSPDPILTILEVRRLWLPAPPGVGFTLHDAVGDARETALAIDRVLFLRRPERFRPFVQFDWRLCNWLGSILFLVVACLLLGRFRGLEHALLLAVVWALCVPFLWFSESLGQWLGIPPLPGGIGSRPITQESPPWLVLLFAWSILLGVGALLTFAS